MTNLKNTIMKIAIILNKKLMYGYWNDLRKFLAGEKVNHSWCKKLQLPYVFMHKSMIYMCRQWITMSYTHIEFFKKINLQKDDHANTFVSETVGMNKCISV